MGFLGLVVVEEEMDGVGSSSSRRDFFYKSADSSNNILSIFVSFYLILIKDHLLHPFLILYFL